MRGQSRCPSRTSDRARWWRRARPKQWWPSFYAFPVLYSIISSSTHRVVCTDVISYKDLANCCVLPVVHAMAAAPTPTNEHPAHHETYCFDDLDDGVVLRVMQHLDPLPHRFLAARSCKRLHNLCTDPRLWLTVTPTNAPALNPATPPHATLAEAIAASRPGDTILLQPGVHNVQGVVVTWPLTIRGAGAAPEHTVLRCPRGADFAIDFFASSRLLNLTVASVRSPAVVHSAGQLVLERCVLRCRTEGLDHLLTPLHTRATTVSTRALRVGANAMDKHAAMAALRASLQAVQDKGAVAAPPPSTDDDGSLEAAGVGRLLVAECVLQVRGSLEMNMRGVYASCMIAQGGLRAVRCAGSGSVSNVRVIQHTSATLFWLEVDSAGGVGGSPVGPPTPMMATCRQEAVLAEPCHEHLEARAACHECVQRKRLRLSVGR